jgi:2-polyprenyl-3-methyl-5-hydroxy-6-metoxy-1,4-benzoquinol methylase
LPFKNNFFDVVTAFDVIEHVKDYKKAIKNIFRVLKPNGIFLLSTPIEVKGFFKKFPSADKDTTHVTTFTEEEIKALLIKNKLDVQKIYYYYYLGLPIPHKKCATMVSVPSKKFATNVLIISKKSDRDS